MGFAGRHAGRDRTRAAVNIRPYREADFDAVLALWQACDLLRPWNPPAGDIAFCRRSGHGEVLVAEANEAIIGTAMVGHDGHRGWIYYVAVDPARRRSGLGRALMAAAEAWLRVREVAKVQLLIRETNSAVAGFYERLGYAAEPRLVMSKRLREQGHDKNAL
ncbi:MAG: GNAT family acetyltransferase [Alphaproteobacteria bacterium]|nr:GNAT family acetyltransferase [Alphaproteobacteria bacterium]